MSVQDHHQGSASISLSSHMGLDMPSLELPMCSHENPPQLALSDIMYHMSPSPPVPAEDPGPEDLVTGGQILKGSQREREGSPEPLTEGDVMAMRGRVQELGFSLDRDRNELSIGATGHSDDFGDTLREIVNMVLHLTDPLSLKATQLERQADAISVLTLQRDFLVRQAEEDHNRWRSEREGWDRIAEALLSLRNNSGKSITREDEAERQKVLLESENRALRDKLQDNQNKLSSLESELMKLKPLLLMQPYSAAHLRQNFTSQLQTSSQPPDVALTTGSHRLLGVRPNKPTSDIKGKRREADSASSRTQLETVSEDFGTNEELRLGPSSLTRTPHSGSLTPSANVPLFSGATTSTADIYRRPEPLPQYSYPYNYHYSTPSASPSKSTLIPPDITLDSPSSSSAPAQQHRKTAGSPSKSPGSAVIYSTTSRSHPLPPASPRRARDYVNHPGTSQNPPIRRRNHGIAPLTSDARTEHILLAARRIGRERAGLVAGIKQHADHEKEKHARELEDIKLRQDHERSEKERLERLANGTSGLAYYRSTDLPTSPQQRNHGRSSGPAGAPRTPKRGEVGPTHYLAMSGALGNSPNSSPTRVPASTGPSTFVFVNTSPVTGTSGNVGSVHKRRGSARGSKNLLSNPLTPLDSLLDAARSMMDDGAGEKAGGKINNTRKASEHPESPVSKRRRVSGSGSKTLGRGGGLTGTGTVTRVRSALDVLADQAAAAFDDDPSQTRRGSNNTRGKGKEKIGDEGLSGGGDGEEDNVQEEDDLDDSGLLGSSRVKTTSTNTRATAEPKSTSSMSLRPVRQPSQKRLASQDLQPSPSIPMTAAARIKGKSRGRPKGSKSLHRSAVSVKTSSTVGLASLKSRRGEGERSEEHSQRTTIDLNRSSSPRLGLRPVVDWGERDAEEDEGDEDVKGEADGEYSPLVATERELGLDQQNVQENPDTDAAGNDTVTTPRAESGSFVRDMDTETQINTLSNVPTNDVSPTDVDLMTIPPVEDVRTVANAEADLDDEDAEGEQEEEEEDENAEAGQDPSSRSRTPPPPPDPPHSGNSNNNDPDADADAEGEMEYEEISGLPPTSTSSAVHQTALSVPIGQVPLGNFDGGVSLIIFWIKSEKSFGYNTTLAHVLISVPGRLPSSLSILSGLSEKMTLRLVYPEQERKAVGWWRNIDVKLGI